jgi:hypothetical protein
VRELSCRHELGDYRQRQRVADLSCIGPRSQDHRVEAAGSDDVTAWSGMPDFSLTKQEQDDLIAYIFSLRTK